MGKIISFSNQKGGVGKTTSCVSIAAALGRRGKRVLLVDIDPQGNATSGVGIGKKAMHYTVYDVLLGSVPAADVVLLTPFRNLSLLPATIALAGAEIDLQAVAHFETRLKEALEPLREQYDYILIDCPPSLGLLTVSALTASDGVVIPMQCEFFALEGMSQLLITIKKVRQRFNPSLELVGILLTMYNGRFTLTKQVVEELKKYYADKIFKTPISRSVKISEAPGFGTPISYHDPYGKGSLEYDDAAKELMSRI